MATRPRSHNAAAALVSVLLLLLTTLVTFHVAWANAGRATPAAMRPRSAAERTRLLDAARAPGLAAWQRRHMEYVARAGALPVRAPRPQPMATAATTAAPRAGTLASDCLEYHLLSPDTQVPEPASAGYAWDATRNRLIVYGGLGYAFQNGEIWALSLAGTTPAWARLTTTNDPGWTVSPALVYDSARDRIVVYDTYNGGNLWELPLSTLAWNAITPQGGPPAPWNGCSAIYDAPRDRMVVYGGAAGEDVWALSFAGTPTWSNISPAVPGPEERDSQTAIFDAPRNRMVLFGGSGHSSGGLLNDSWALSLSGTPAWTPLATSGTPPIPRYGAVSVFDAPRSRMLVYGGYADNGVDFSGDTNDLYALALSGSPKWTALTPAAQQRVTEFGTAAYDPTNQRLVAAGGSLTADEVWTLSLSVNGAPWTQATGGLPPAQREDHDAILDAPRDRLVMFGGDLGGAPHNDTWAYAFATNSWSLLVPSGTRPLPRLGPSCIFDAPRNRMIVFGGASDLAPDGDLNDVWALSLSGTPAWTKLTPSGTPPDERAFASTIYDPVRQRLVIWGGTGAQNYNDAWALNLSGSPQWTPLATNGSPPEANYAVRATYDPAIDAMVLIDQTFGNDVSLLSLGTTPPAWTHVTPAPVPGVGTPYSSLDYAYEAANDRILIYDQNSTYWSLELGASPAFTLLPVDGVTPTGRSYFTMVYDVSRSRPVVFGGSSNAFWLNDVFAIEKVASPVSLDIDISPPGAGTVARDPDRHCYPSGTTVQLTASSPYGLTFTGWSGDASGTSNPLTTTMSGARHLVANFDAYTLTVSASPGSLGSVGIGPNQPAYAPGSTVSLHAFPVSGVRFTGWSGDASGTTNPLTVTMDAPRTIVANFEVIPPACGGWNLMATNPGPSGRLNAGSAIDPVRHRLFVLGGNHEGAIGDLWALALGTGTWTQPLPSGTPPSVGEPVMKYDPVRDRMLVVRSDNSYPTLGVWALSLGASPAWTSVHATPPGRGGAAVIYDPVRDRLLLFGGYDYSTSTYSNEVWQLPLASPTWALVATGGTPPSPRRFHSAIYDPVRDRMLVFGGETAVVGNTNELWSLSLAGTPQWQQLVPGGTAPSPRIGQRAIYDPVRDRMIVFGAYASEGLMNQVWCLALAQTPFWDAFPATGVFAPREGTTFDYDAATDAAIEFGGYRPATGAYYPDVYRLILSGGWALDAGAVPGVRGTVARSPNLSCYDPGTTVTLTASGLLGGTFQGWSGNASGTTNPLTIVMDGNKQIVANFDTPTPTLLSQFEATGGDGGITLRWRFGENAPVRGATLERGEAADGPWHPLTLDTRDENGATVAVDRSAVGGRDYWYRLDVTLLDGKTATFGPVSSRAEETIVASAITQVTPNPSAGRTAIHFAVARQGRVTLAVVDVAGRRVATLVDESRQPGRYTLTWDGGGGRAGRLSPGVYFLRLSSPDRSVVQRVVMIR